MSTISSPSTHFHGRELPAGFIFEVARAAGIEVTFGERKQTICCPFHEDRIASAFLSPDNIFYCSVCTPAHGLSAKAFATRIGVDWITGLKGTAAARVVPNCEVQAVRAVFTTEMARNVWRAAHARARDDERVDDDRAAYDYLERRGLMPSWEFQLFGLLAHEMALPTSVQSWPAQGYRVLVPLYDGHGEVASLQARSVKVTRVKTLFPAGSKIRALVFANAAGQEVLRGGRVGEDVILGEGLTDFLALSITSRVPVLAAPGVNFCTKGIGPWVRGRRLLLALDCDAAGDAVVDAVSNAALERGATSVMRIRWPVGCKDACEFVERIGVDGLAALLVLQTKGSN